MSELDQIKKDLAPDESYNSAVGSFNLKMLGQNQIIAEIDFKVITKQPGRPSPEEVLQRIVRLRKK